MARTKSIEAHIRDLEPAERPYSKGFGRGLSLLVQPNGSKWWRFRYQHNGKPKMLSLGVWPDVPHELAEQRRDAHRKQVATDFDPALERQRVRNQKKTKGENTFAAIAEAWHNEPDRRELKAHTRFNIERRLKIDINPLIGSIPVQDLTPDDIRNVIRTAKARGVLDTATRIGKIITAVCEYAEDQGMASHNVAAGVRVAKIVRKPPAKHQAAITDPEEFGELMQAICGYTGRSSTTACLTLLAHCFCRPENAREARWKDINLRTRQWIIPAADMKKTLEKPRDLIVSLSDQMVELLRDMKKQTGHGEYVFPCQSRGDRPVSENTLNKALHTLGFKDRHVSHGFRASARTMLDERLRFRPDIIEIQLGHITRDANGAAYNRTAFLDDRKAMMQAWSDYIDQLVAGNKKVAAIGQAA
ncbi:MAG: DUF4102 domain-containing protein [Nitrosomonas sp.]|nr:MAG: DUF4102 domain-containing protein [Nitrosomonas sp.]